MRIISQFNPNIKMNKKKTTFVWIFLVLFGLYLLFETIGFVRGIFFSFNYTTALLRNPPSSPNPILNLLNPFLNIPKLLLSLPVLVIGYIFFMKLYNVKKDVIKWANIFFVYFLLLQFISFIFLIPHYAPVIKSGSILPPLSRAGGYATVFGLILLFSMISNILMILIGISMWIGIVKHIKRAQKEKLMDFS